MSRPPTTILLADDHTLFSESLKMVLEDRTPDMRVVAIAVDGTEAVHKCLELKPEIVLMDVRMPQMDGVQATRHILEVLPQTKIIMLTTFADDDYVRQALQFGAKGYLLKNVRPSDLIESIRRVRDSFTQLSPEIITHFVEPAAGQGPRRASAVVLEKLTPREKEVLRLLVDARENAEIARILGITEQTVKNHVHHLYEKLGIFNRIQLVKVLGNHS